MPVIISIVLIAIGAGLAFYYLSRRSLREAKNYERGLKMVPLYIHLPPTSDDIEVGSRDVRDVVEENVSRAQIMYNIIASTAKSGFKSKFYGQRHISFEIIASKGLVYYYAAVPVALVPVIEQAVVSAYPTARLEEVSEHNIFSPVGKIAGTTGGELVLKQSFSYPISTYQDLKRDAMQSLLNAFSTLSKEDGAGIQILLRPASKSWTSKAQSEAGKKKKNKGQKKGAALFGSYAAQIIQAPIKAPEGKDSETKPEDKQLSSLEQSVVDAIEEKTRHPGYEVLIRLIVSSNTSQKAQTILQNVVASFSLFDSPGKNGFKFVPAKDIESFTTAYILRFFPPEVNQNILNSVELSTIFHFPDQKSIPTSKLERQASKQVDGPQNMSYDGLLLGYNVFRGLKKEIRLSKKDRQRHMYIIGQTGTGKSVLLENLALQDMLDGNGFAFIDPHGDAAENLLSMVPKERAEDVVYFSPGDMDFPLGLNLFEFHNPDQKDFIIQEAINMLEKLYDPNNQGIVGPRYHHLFRNAALTIMADPAGGTFVDIPKLFSDTAYVQQKLKFVTDQNVLDFWLKEMPASQRSNEFGEVKSWFVSKFGAFLSNAMMRNIIGQTQSAFNLREIMDNKKILLVNLSKGRTGELNSKLLGMIFVMKFQAAAMSRADVPESQRNDFSLYVDEFQNFSTESFATILAEARKYHLNLIVANQYIGQLTDDIRDAVFGNVGSIVSLRSSATDADFLVKTFSPIFDTEDIVKLPNYNAIVRIMIGGVPSQPFSMNTIPPLGTANPKLGLALKQLSAAKYGRPRSLVEKEIFDRISTKTPSKPSSATFSPSGYNNSQPTKSFQQSAAPGMPQKAPASFLDNWLAKRKSATKNQNLSGVQTGSSNITPIEKTASHVSSPSGGGVPADMHKKVIQPINNLHNKSDKKVETSLPHNKSVSMDDLEKKEGLVGDITVSNTSQSPESEDDIAKILSSMGEDEVYIDKDGNLHYGSKPKPENKEEAKSDD